MTNQVDWAGQAPIRKPAGAESLGAISAQLGREPPDCADPVQRSNTADPTHRRLAMSDNEDSMGGSGRGGATGTPDSSLDEAPPSGDQEANAVVSGGGVVGSEDDEGPKDTAKS